MKNKNEIGTFLLRIVLGLVFLANGAAKFQGGIGNTAGWFESIGIPGSLAYPVSIIELAGGIAIILGLGTRIVSMLFGMIMIGAIVTVKLPAGFLNGYVYDLVLLIIAIHMVLNGSKWFSLGQLLFRSKEA
ncbi:DoxX family protein [Bacillus sp. DTU_2020_1000418_1_SI_GHA_SEK_038]|uniref:DoxX family protein n=1 Tax=Bacillus sp. DTU_2020_1000418_1_SI_GHA_SEK_038 TaxID=3077585 RepID=UPI0028F0559D|nr:DoxX family protein [Bacillus sp. DTU_2020_1000418_1_SI_GHA_SEK_038]WNS75736.1 DoxX family protein [Bacillus sp. DTU_2020_1000418_1_SI_GHA_SEK_038]